MPKGLTLNKLIAFAAAPKQGPAAQFNILSLELWKYLETSL